MEAEAWRNEGMDGMNGMKIETTTSSILCDSVMFLCASG